MSVISAVAFIAFASVVFAGLAVVATFPSWLVGRLSAGKNKNPPANAFVLTRTRRLAVFSAFSIIAFAGINELGQDHLTAGAVTLALGSVGAQYMAFAIGFIDGDRRYARRHARDYAPEVPMTPPPAPLGEGSIGYWQSPTPLTEQTLVMPDADLGVDDFYRPSSTMWDADYVSAQPNDDLTK